MARDFSINGETLVLVKGMQGTFLSHLQELGLSDSQIRITPKFSHKDMHADDFGPDIPPDVMWMLAEVQIAMTLIHFDQAVLEAVITESMCGVGFGVMQAAGTPMGGGVARFANGNHYVGLNLTSPVLGKPWRFLTSLLTGPPVEIPLGVEASIVQLNWRAIPYAPPTAELLSAGKVLFDRTLDS